LSASASVRALPPDAPEEDEPVPLLELAPPLLPPDEEELAAPELDAGVESVVHAAMKAAATTRVPDTTRRGVFMRRRVPDASAVLSVYVGERAVESIEKNQAIRPLHSSRRSNEWRHG